MDDDRAPVAALGGDRAAQGPAAVVRAYIVHGIRHIAFGAHHLLFVPGLLLLVKDRWMLVKTITAFTVAHSITLAIATSVTPTPNARGQLPVIALALLAGSRGRCTGASRCSRCPCVAGGHGGRAAE